MTTDTRESLDYLLMELVRLGIILEESIRRREIRGVWLAYARLSPEFT